MKEIICMIFGHKYTLLRYITSWCREIKCNRCKKEFAMNDELRYVLPLDNDLKELNNLLLKS